MPEFSRPRRAIRFGAFEADLSSGELRKHGLRIKLQDQPFQILVMLLDRPGEVLTREELHQKLWPTDTFVDFDHGLNNAINRLREALNDSADSPRYIQTLPRRGYRFIAAVNDGITEETQPSPSLAPLGESSFAAAPQKAAADLAQSAMPRRRFGNLWLAVAGVGVAAILILWAYLGRARPFGAHSAVRIQSIAVLPLENLSGDPSQDYFADGMTDALITELAQVRGLKVISRTSVMHYKGARKTLPEIARELGVDAVLEGTVERSGNEVKITAQLIRAATDTHLWAASYRRVQQDVLCLQAELAEEVTRQISDQLVPPGSMVGSKSAINPEAYDAYLKGVYYLNQYTPDSVNTAIRYFQKATAKEPNFAVAYSRLTQCYAFLSTRSEMSSAKAYARAKEAAQKAIALDDNLDQAHMGLAWIAISDWDWKGAETEYKRAIQLNPNSVDAHLGYSYLLMILEKPEQAGAEERAAEALDPLSFNVLVGNILTVYYRRQYDGGVEKARAALQLYPRVPLFHVFLSNFYTAQGKDKLAAQEILLAEETSGVAPERLAALKAANEMAGVKGLRRKRIELNIKQAAKSSINAYDIAVDCAAVGEANEALAWLERALKARDSKIMLIGVEPLFDGLRSDPRFTSLLREMRLNPAHS